LLPPPLGGEDGAGEEGEEAEEGEQAAAEDRGLLGLGTLRVGGAALPLAAVYLAAVLLGCCCLCCLVGVCACRYRRRARRKPSLASSSGSSLSSLPSKMSRGASSSVVFTSLTNFKGADSSVQIGRPKTVVHAGLTEPSSRPKPPPPPSAPPVLANGWEETRTEAGDVYYYNLVTGETRWEPPEELTGRQTLHGVSEQLATAGASNSEVSTGAGYLKAHRQNMQGLLTSTRPGFAR